MYYTRITADDEIDATGLPDVPMCEGKTDHHLLVRCAVFVECGTLRVMGESRGST